MKGFTPFTLFTLCGRVLALLCALALPATAFSQITNLGGLNGATFAEGIGISGDGSVVVGFANDGAAGNAGRAFRWTEAGGMVSLGVLSGGNSSFATATSFDGSVVVGNSEAAGTGFNSRAFRWTQAGGMINLGTLAGGTFSSANGVNGDGSVVVGSSDAAGTGSNNRAFRWTQAGGMVDLGTLAGGTSSFAISVNSDGSVVVGGSNATGTGQNVRAFRWTAGVMVDLGVLNTGNFSSASGVNSDGSVVVGSASDGAAANATRAFRWTQAGGLLSLGVLNGGTFSFASDVNGDGSVVVGAAENGAAGNALRAFRWTQATGIQSVEDWLRANGVNVPVDITHAATGVSADGNVVTGSINDGNDAFIARVGGGGGGGGSGLVTLADVQNSLAATASGGSTALSVSSTVIGGAHSHPLARRVAKDKKAFWVAGDWGRDDHGSRSGDLGLAEVGGGIHLGPVQLNLALGRTWAKQELILGGQTDTDGTYLLLEGLIPVADKLWATIGGYAHRGDATLRRGYLNAGVQDFSTGTPDVNTWGVRTRLDWENAATLANVNLTPYADLSYSEAKIDAYTEVGGGFPALFNARTDKATDLRFGVNASRPIATDVHLLGTLEVAHRFEKTGVNTSGQLIGLFGFNLAGAAIKQDWLRAGIGVEGKLAEGTASLMLNVTTKGEVPNAWLAASWQMAF